MIKRNRYLKVNKFSNDELTNRDWFKGALQVVFAMVMCLGFMVVFFLFTN